MMLSSLLLFTDIGITTDFLIGTDYPVDFYTVMDSPKLELFDVIVYLIHYPLYGYFFTYMIYLWGLRGGYLCLYVLLWSGLTTGIDWISITFNVFTYLNGWRIEFSALAYLFVFSLSALIVKLFIHYWGKNDPV